MFVQDKLQCYAMGDIDLTTLEGRSEVTAAPRSSNVPSLFHNVSFEHSVEYFAEVFPRIPHEVCVYCFRRMKVGDVLL